LRVRNELPAGRVGRDLLRLRAVALPLGRPRDRRGHPPQRGDAARVPVGGAAGPARGPRRGRGGRRAMRLRPPRRSRRLAALLLAVALGSAAAHPMLVLGEVAFEPDPPAPGAEALVTLTLRGASRGGVGDGAGVLGRRPGPPPGGGSRPVGRPLVATDRLGEASPGVDQASLTLPADGAYTLSVRDRTCRQEEAVANV